MDATITPTLIVANLPRQALCGIDLLSFTTSLRFQGIKDLPPGWHFLFCATTNSLSLRHGVWFYIDESHPVYDNIIVKKWNASAEELESADAAEALSWRANLSAIWKDGLAPYRQSATKGSEFETEDRQDWQDLTEHLTAALLCRITGGTANDWTIDSASSAKRDQDHIPGLTSAESALEEEKELHFLPLDLKQTWRDGAVGRERTNAAKDRSWALGDIINNYCHDDNQYEILGEFQFCFLMMLVVANYSCLEQWKRILELLCTCVEAVHTNPIFFTKFLRILQLQLQHSDDVEGGLFDLSDEGAGVLKKLLMTLKKTLDESSEAIVFPVKEQFDELEDFLKSQYKWELSSSYVRKGLLELEDGEMVEMETNDFEEDEETGEYAPMVVELDDSQAKMIPGF
ncbi:MAG: hypothetical protein M1834_006633 [Cirrosporium novae-zelandiae]|nr:MAG: hypothetical protein M1834_006633 [Cirrosporium novae-zelandiae]